MRNFKTYLDEGKQDYINFLGSVYKDSKSKNFVESELKWAIAILKRQDRVMWYLRLVKLYAYRFIDEKLFQNEIEKLKKNPSKDIIVKSGAGNAIIDIDDLKSSNPSLSIFNRWKVFLEHFFLQEPILPDIDSYIFKFQTPLEIGIEFDDIEKKYLEELEHTKNFIPDHPDYENIIEFPDGYVWQNTHKSFCDLEAKAMGHCGNVEGRSRTSDDILSLRKKHKKMEKVFWEPFLTFVLSGTGYLGEMKGRANEKPREKYHKYIIELLKRDDIVSGITPNAGYLPQNNFKLSDLDSEELDDLIKERPDLADLNTLVNMHGSEEPLVQEKARKILDLVYNTRTIGGEKYYVLDNISSERYSSDYYTTSLSELRDTIDEKDNTSDFVGEIIQQYISSEVLIALSKHYKIDEKNFDTNEEFVDALKDKILGDSDFNLDFLLKTGIYGEYIGELKRKFMVGFLNSINYKMHYRSYSDGGDYYDDSIDLQWEYAYFDNFGNWKLLHHDSSDDDYISAYDNDSAIVISADNNRAVVDAALILELELERDDGDYDDDDDELEPKLTQFSDKVVKEINNIFKKHLGFGGFDHEKQMKLFQSFREFHDKSTGMGKIPKVRVVEDGYTFQTGREVTFPFLHNTEKSPYFGKRFQQDIEPKGTYMILNSEPEQEPTPGWIKGKITFKKPFVIPFNLDYDNPIYDENSWKSLLVRKYKKRGFELTQKLKQDGYDGIVTVDVKSSITSEIVGL